LEETSWALVGLVIIFVTVFELSVAQRWVLLNVIYKAVLKLARKCDGIPGSRAKGIDDTVRGYTQKGAD